MFEKILKLNYNIAIKSITQIEGGWSALAYIVEDFDNIKYLLKVYEKSRASTAYLTSKVDTYMPIVDWLNQNTKLRDKIIHKIIAHLEQLDILKFSLKELLKPFSNAIKQAIIILKELSQTSKESNLNLCLCHTDIHEGNILQNESGLVLIDWEGLKLAPVEADFFEIVRKDWQAIFFEEYKKEHPSYEFNTQTLLFYQLRRVLEDIWEFIEQIQYDELTQEEEQSSLDYLKIECSSLKNYL